AAGMRAVLRHSIDMCRDVHGQHPEQKASENLQGGMTTRRAVEVIPDDEQQYPSDKDADHVYVKPRPEKLRNAVLRRPIETCREAHGQHPGEKACESMQNRTAGRRAVEEIPDRQDQYPHNKDSDHVMAKP